MSTGHGAVAVESNRGVTHIDLLDQRPVTEMSTSPLLRSSTRYGVIYDFLARP